MQIRSLQERGRVDLPASCFNQYNVHRCYHRPSISTSTCPNGLQTSIFASRCGGGYLIVYTTFAKFYQFEVERSQTNMRTEQIFHERWANVWQATLYYNPKLQSKSFSRTR